MGIHQFADKPLGNAQDLRMATNEARRAFNDLAEATYFMAQVIKATLTRHEKHMAKQRAMDRAKADAERVARTGEDNRATSLGRVIARAASDAAGKAWRVKAVVVVLAHASDKARSGARLCDKAYRVFQKHYINDLVGADGDSFATKEQNVTLVNYDRTAAAPKTTRTAAPKTAAPKTAAPKTVTPKTTGDKAA